MGFRKKKPLTPEEEAALELRRKQRDEERYDMDEEDRYDSNGNKIIEEDNDEELDGKRRKDKIYGNAFNAGETGYQDLPDIKAEGDYAGRHLGHVYDTEEYNMRMKLSAICSDAFDASQWSGLPLNKKFSKELMPYIFQDL